MANLSVTNTFVTSTIISAPGFNTNLSDIVSGLKFGDFDVDIASCDVSSISATNLYINSSLSFNSTVSVVGSAVFSSNVSIDANSNFLRFNITSESKTISSGAFTPSKSFVKLSGQTDPDDLDTIDDTNFSDGSLLYLKADGEIITIKHNTDNIFCDFDRVLRNDNSVAKFIYDGVQSKFVLLSISENL